MYNATGSISFGRLCFSFQNFKSCVVTFSLFQSREHFFCFFHCFVIDGKVSGRYKRFCRCLETFSIAIEEICDFLINCFRIKDSKKTASDHGINYLFIITEGIVAVYFFSGRNDRIVVGNQCIIGVFGISDVIDVTGVNHGCAFTNNRMVL